MLNELTLEGNLNSSVNRPFNEEFTIEDVTRFIIRSIGHDCEVTTLNCKSVKITNPPNDHFAYCFKVSD